MIIVRQLMSLAGLPTLCAMSRSASFRQFRFVLSLLFLFGMFGLPAEFFGRTATQTTERLQGGTTHCCCNVSKQRAGGCCCRTRRSTTRQDQSSCCSSKSKPVSAKVIASKRQKSSNRGRTSVSDKCVCGSGPTAILSNFEPHVLSMLTEVVVQRTVIDRVWSCPGRVCGLRPVPAVPPPEFFVV